jgi:hypothetical protein
MSEPRLPDKSHDIPKRLIWAAWLKVKSKAERPGRPGAGVETAGRVRGHACGAETGPVLAAIMSSAWRERAELLRRQAFEYLIGIDVTPQGSIVNYTDRWL